MRNGKSCCKTFQIWNVTDVLQTLPAKLSIPLCNRDEEKGFHYRQWLKMFGFLMNTKKQQKNEI